MVGIGGCSVLAQDSEDDGERTSRSGDCAHDYLNDSARALPVYGTLLQHTPENESYRQCLERLPLPVRGLNAHEFWS